MRGFIRVIEDILLSERNSKGEGKGKGRALYVIKSEREQGREIVYKKVRVLAKILRNQAF
jgi:hypothetical protein